MPWHLQVTRHYLNHWWPSSVMEIDISGPPIDNQQRKYACLISNARNDASRLAIRLISYFKFRSLCHVLLKVESFKLYFQNFWKERFVHVVFEIIELLHHQLSVINSQIIESGICQITIIPPNFWKVWFVQCAPWADVCVSISVNGLNCPLAICHTVSPWLMVVAVGCL